MLERRLEAEKELAKRTATKERVAEENTAEKKLVEATIAARVIEEVVAKTALKAEETDEDDLMNGTEEAHPTADATPTEGDQQPKKFSEELEDMLTAS